MRILHTSDWHLGKTLENRSRLEEQSLFIEELCTLADEQRADLLIIAGDIYDSINPPAAAEKLFYSGIKKLSKNGARPILIIAGNHDSPERLTAASPLASELGIVLLGTPKSIAQFGTGVVTEAGEGYVELQIGGEALVVIALPYLSEKRLNEMFLEPDKVEPEEEKGLQKTYSEKVATLLKTLSEKYRADSINICTGHFYVRGGQTSSSERDIELGGIFAVDAAALPETAQYIALGHLHRPQQIAPRAYYSGSPIQYSAGETGYAKCVYMVELSPGTEARVEKLYLRNYKPIEIWKMNSVEEALSYCEAHKDDHCWVFLHIKTDRPFLQSEIKQLKLTKKDIIEIRPLLPNRIESQLPEQEERSVLTEFMDYYQQIRGAPASEDLIKLFMALSGEEEDDETG